MKGGAARRGAMDARWLLTLKLSKKSSWREGEDDEEGGSNCIKVGGRGGEGRGKVGKGRNWQKKLP